MANLVVKQQPKTGRVGRRPEIRFNVSTMPWQLAPFLIHPVLPGETMKNLAFQSRVITDPIRNAIMGWHKEYFFFYVKLTDLDGREDFKEMMLDAEKDMSSYHEAADRRYLHAGNGIPWAKLCMKRVVEEYFRDPGEAWDNVTILGNPAVAHNYNGYWDSAADTTLVPDGGEVPQDADNVTFEGFDRERRTWEYMRTMSLTDMDWEDWLATYGVNVKREKPHRPELLRHIKEWTYPTNTVNPADGTPTTACSWSIGERADKDRFFKEPGFIFGVTCARPKVFLKNARGSLTSHMDSAFAWLPALLKDDPATSLFEFDNLTSPLTGLTNDVWIDMRDLLIHGEQLTTWDLSTAVTAGSINTVNLPSAALNLNYPSQAMAEALFVSETSGTAQAIREDGIVHLNILGTQVDQT